MTESTKKVLGQALKLSTKERWSLMNQLMDSLDDEHDADYEEAWAQEIKRRVAELDSGKARTIPWEEVRRSILGLKDEPTRR